MKPKPTLTVCLAGLALCLAVPSAWAADGTMSEDAMPTGTNLSLSVSGPAQRGDWQKRLTLGPGDVLNISLLDQTNSTRNPVIIGPDGRINYLEVQDFVASGLTVDELREKLDVALAKFYQAPRTIIVPVAYNSKKYFVLGAVVNKGVFSLDRPTTIIEAIARAGGLQTGLYEQSTVELADLTRSFLARNGKHLPVDFERLFQRGDLTQNIPLEPGDYLYFASANDNEIYVLGEVMNPGTVSYSPKPTVIGVIAARGGYSDNAFRSRVLVVRGSLSHPETFVVDTSAILAGRIPDFRLQPKDIVYVSRNPWVTAVQVLDTAASAFVQSFTVQAVSRKVGPFITTPLIK